MILLQLFLAFIGFVILMGLITLLAALFGFRRAMHNLRREASKTAHEAEDGSLVFEARPCPRCGTYLSEPPRDGNCPACGKAI
jgi:rubrerythrin